MYRSFAAASLLLVAALVWAVVDNHAREWRSAQYAYRALLDANVDPGHATPAMPIAQRQIFLPELGVVDRCVSCHVGIDNPDMAGKPQPHGFHSGTYLAAHPPERFGCTPCHGGEGRALTLAGASHVPGPDSVTPMVSPAAIEARCGTCHQGREVPGAPHLSEGRRLLTEVGCAACHELPGLQLTRPFGPALDAVGEKLREDELARWITDPGAVVTGARMPHFRFADGEIAALAAFLAAQRAPALPDQDPSASGDPEAGRGLFGVLRCTTCHALHGKGGNATSGAPPLDRVGERVSPSWLVAWLTNPERLSPATLMPRYNLTAEQVNDLAAYLLEEMVGDHAPTDLPRRPGPVPAPDRIAAGRAAFLARGCSACHELAGFDRTRQVAPSLVDYGARPVERLTFATLPADTHRTLADWTFQKIAHPASSGNGATMPDVALTPEQTADLTLALLSLRPSPTTVPAPSVVAPKLAGEVGALFSRYRCLSCHTLGGVGGTIAHVPLDREGSKVQRPWLEAFLLAPDTLRVAQEERMPKLGLTPDEAATLADYILLVLRDDRIPSEPPPLPIVPPRRESAVADQVADGAKAYASLGCAACHIAGKDGGYVGPDLFRSGSRLARGWVYALLTDPGLMAPEMDHPGEPLDPATAAALTAFLATLTPTAAEGGAP